MAGVERTDEVASLASMPTTATAVSTSSLAVVPPSTPKLAEKGTSPPSAKLGNEKRARDDEDRALIS